ncbi:hypothetical protein [Flammeovirga kamogawensis]|uniref:LysM domain-containing protein n=1 Tax=Flammeovirga kamogawensis TaxID=373891 RepID=A0ABX8GU19_9BACT|nr:hypothetical protein [Flammeovirga kamogawensis]MBB6462480.1 hypothetical protein [Flammeovirga kamogawensis]QWG06782.1 hypothetical protein KM029_15950 [Flammeovirga kamogawensis]TRX68605.1 hypothetical protein EO216_10945 [Flammeovirga kamogawensis]
MTINTFQKYTLGFNSSDNQKSTVWIKETSSDSLIFGTCIAEEDFSSHQKNHIETAFKESSKPQVSLKNAAKIVKENNGVDHTLIYLKDRRMWHSRNGKLRVFVYRQGRFLSPPHNKVSTVVPPFLLKEDDQLIIANASLFFNTDPKLLKEIFSSSLPQEVAERLISNSSVENETLVASVLPCEFLRDNTPSRHREKALSDVFPNEREVNERLANPSQQKNTIYNFIGFVLFALLIGIMYNQNKSNWKGELKEKNKEIALLKKKIEKSDKIIESYNRYQRQHIKSISERNFDALDNERYRMYALFRDTRSKFNRTQVADKFNIYNPLAIESKVVMDENWFIVPVKGSHLLQKGETLSYVAKMYYENEKEGIQLIQEFNPQVVEGHSIFLPFEQED